MNTIHFKNIIGKERALGNTNLNHFADVSLLF